jgi:riboflavin transporter FmnP
MKNKNVAFVTRTAVLLALCVIVQLVTSVQMVKGPLVNVVLLIAAIACGLPCGLIVAVLNPLLVFVISAPAAMKLCPQILPVVMVGNCVLVAVAWMLRKPLMGIAGLAAGAVAKALVMGALTSYVVVPLFGAKLAAKGIDAAVKLMFGISQLYTALIGAAVFFVLWQVLKKVPGFAAKDTEK